MTLALFLKFLHILAAFWLVIGIIGRGVVQYKAAQSQDIQAVRALLTVSTVFERGMVIPASTAVLLAGLVTAWAQGWPILGFLQGGTSNWVLVSLLLFLSMMPIIPFVFLPRGKVFEREFTAAVEQGQVTPELTAAFHDPAVRAGHIYEIAAIVVIIALMVLKPF
jgi:uncharacterized membrane protein